MKLTDCYIGQKVGLMYNGAVLAGIVESIVGNIVSFSHPEYETIEVNVKKLLGVLK